MPDTTTRLQMAQRQRTRLRRRTQDEMARFLPAQKVLGHLSVKRRLPVRLGRVRNRSRRTRPSTAVARSRRASWADGADGATRRVSRRVTPLAASHERTHAAQQAAATTTTTVTVTICILCCYLLHQRVLRDKVVPARLKPPQGLEVLVVLQHQTIPRVAAGQRVVQRTKAIFCITVQGFDTRKVVERRRMPGNHGRELQEAFTTLVVLLGLNVGKGLAKNGLELWVVGNAVHAHLHNVAVKLGLGIARTLRAPFTHLGRTCLGSRRSTHLRHQLQHQRLIRLHSVNTPLTQLHTHLLILRLGNGWLCLATHARLLPLDLLAIARLLYTRRHMFTWIERLVNSGR
mmetsp:Transcript_11456/g.36415  ORF Transcript_11456/g.36415 Transcript_11456/m.36415 type:complete len:345 (-) Transcript_11456:272-1306(-)